MVVESCVNYRIIDNIFFILKKKNIFIFYITYFFVRNLGNSIFKSFETKFSGKCDEKICYVENDNVFLFENQKNYIMYDVIARTTLKNHETAVFWVLKHLKMQFLMIFRISFINP